MTQSSHLSLSPFWRLMFTDRISHSDIFIDTKRLRSISMKKSEAIIENHRRPSRDANNVLHSISDGYSHATRCCQVGSTNVFRVGMTCVPGMHEEQLLFDIWYMFFSVARGTFHCFPIEDGVSVLFLSAGQRSHVLTLAPPFAQQNTIGKEKEKGVVSIASSSIHLPQEREKCLRMIEVSHSHVFITSFLLLSMLCRGFDEHRTK